MSNEKEKTEVKGMVSKQENYSVEIKYSEEAEKKKLIKFIPKEGTPIEIEADKLIELLSHYVNSDMLAPTFVDTEKITVVYVKRQLKCRLDRDMKSGEEINIEYSHPYPLEFAIIEEGYKIALIDESRPGVIVTPEILKQVKRDTPKESKNFIKKFYKSFKSLDLGGSS